MAQKASIVDELLLVSPAIQLSDFLAHNLCGMLCCDLPHSVEMYLVACVGHIEKEVLCEAAVLNIGENLLHSLLRVLGDDLGTGDIVAVLCGVGDGISHSLKAGLIDKIDDKLHLVNTLEISVSGVVACLNEGLKACLHKSANAAAKDSLLTEEVGLGLGAEGGLKNACACAADAESVCKADLKCITGCILMNCDKTRNAVPA